MTISIATAPKFLNGLFDHLADRGRAMLRMKPPAADASRLDVAALAERLLSRRGEASGVALAQDMLSAYHAATPQVRLDFLKALVDRFGPDRRKVTAAVEAFVKGEGGIENLHSASEPRRQELLRRLNLCPGGTEALIRMREDLLGFIKENPELSVADTDFAHLFSSWFNRGFLVLRPIDWTTPANILEKIIRHEAVHEIRDWDDLRGRLEPADRRCYGFFHPQLVDEPLIFVEIALTREIPHAIASLLDPNRKPIAATEASTAVFYSISNTQKGLGGVSFGNFLIKQVVQDLARELPNLKTFVTLSPVPGFASWLTAERRAEFSRALDAKSKDDLQVLDEQAAAGTFQIESARDALISAAAFYFLKAKTSQGRPVDPVARFHLGNGARLQRLNFMGDVSRKGVRQSFGLMVNYLYSLDEIENNHEAYAERGTVAASADVRKALRFDLASNELVPLSAPASRPKLSA